MYIEHQGAGGYLPLQDHDPTFSTGSRLAKYAVRMVDSGPYGERLFEPGTAGDLSGATLWRETSRELPSWSFAFPARVAANPNVTAPGGYRSAGKVVSADSEGDGIPADSDSSASYAADADENDDGIPDDGGGGGGGIVASGQGSAPRGSGMIDIGAAGLMRRIYGFTDSYGWSSTPGFEGFIEVDRSSQFFGARSSFSRFLGTSMDPEAARAFAATAKNGGNGADGQVAAWYGERGTQNRPRSASVLPIRTSSHGLDGRFRRLKHLLAPDWPGFPTGYAMLRVGGTQESNEQPVMLPVDPRLVAPNENGPGVMGTLVCDLEPAGSLPAGTSTAPGLSGRVARLQAMMRVIRHDPPGIAWQLTGSGQDGLCGYGLVYGVTMSKEVIHTVPTTAPDGPILGDDHYSRDPGVTGGWAPQVHAGPGVFNVSVRSPAKYTTTRGGNAVAMMAQEEGGPLGLGCDGDQHQIGTDLDGNPIHSGHLHTDVLFSRNVNEDAPMEYDSVEYPKNASRLISGYTIAVNLSHDPTKNHDWRGQTRKGLWRWWTRVPFYITGGKKRSPGVGTPSDPPPRPGSPVTPRPPPDITPSVGAWFGGSGDGGEQHVMQPGLSGFASLIFRPQDPTAGAIDWLHPGDYQDPDASARDDYLRPATMRVESFGARAGGSWKYGAMPGTSRYPTAAGGLAFMPPETDLFNLLNGITPNHPASLSTSYAVFTPGARLAFGTPYGATGGVKTAVEEYGDAGDLVWAAVDGSGTSTEKMRLTAGGLLTFEGESANEPALRKGGTAILEVRTGNNGAQAAMEALEFRVAGAKVVGAIRNGWQAPTGADSRAAFDPATVTTEELAQRVKALIDDLFAGTGPHGLIGI